MANGNIARRCTGEALHPAREPLETLEKLRGSLGAMQFSALCRHWRDAGLGAMQVLAQYQQTPVPAAGNLIKWRWFRTFEYLPPGATGKTGQSWDAANATGEGNDWACTTWQMFDNDFYLVDVLRERLDVPALKRKMIDHAQRYRADTVLIEDADVGRGLIEQLRHDSALHAVPIQPDGSKIDRMAAASTKIECGQVHLPRSATCRAPPPGSTPSRPNCSPSRAANTFDQVDSVSQFLNWRASHVPRQFW